MPIPDGARFERVCDPSAHREEVAYEYPCGPGTLATELDLPGWTPEPGDIGTGSGKTSGTATP